MLGESHQLLVEQPTTTIDLTAVADNVKLLIVPFPCTALRVGVIITTATTATAAVVDFDRRVTPGSDVGRVDQGVTRLTFPAAIQVAGRIVYKNITPVDLNAGDEIAVQVVTATGGGSAGVPFLQIVARAEEPANNADFVAGT